MESTVQTRPNHYQVLGLEPTATSEEIAQAFKREMSALRPRAFGGLAGVSIAFETLRDPARRLAYDESIGVRPKPEPQRRPPPARPEFKPFMVRAAARPAQARPAYVPPVAKAEPQRQAEPSADNRTVSSIGAALRELAKPGPLAGAPVESPANRASQPQAQPKPEPSVPVFLTIDPGPDRQADDSEGGIDWKWPAMAAGALILGAGMLGAWAGADAGNGAETLQPQEAATLKVPIPKALPDVDSADAATIAAVPASRVESTHRSSGKRERKPLEIRLPEQEEPPLGEPVDPSQLPEIAVDRPATPPAQAAAPHATPAKLPLSNATIARTIGRIGYPCGSVASTTEGDGSGVFTVNCTSGHSYRAAPVRGRYHFRRLSGQ